MIARRTTLFLASIAILLAGGARAERWRSYHNERFGATADTPTNWTMGAAPENDDGRVFASPDEHAQITISGIFANADANGELASRLEAVNGETITFKKRQGKWVVGRPSSLRRDDRRAPFRRQTIPLGERQKLGRI